MITTIIIITLMALFLVLMVFSVLIISLMVPPSIFLLIGNRHLSLEIMLVFMAAGVDWVSVILSNSSLLVFSYKVN